MCVKTGISGGTRQGLAILVGDMLTSLGISIPLGQAEVNSVYVMLSFSQAHNKIVWFDVSVQVQSGVDVLDALNQLVC
jgi:hypothetical protein